MGYTEIVKIKTEDVNSATIEKQINSSLDKIKSKADSVSEELKSLFKNLNKEAKLEVEVTTNASSVVKKLEALKGSSVKIDAEVRAPKTDKIKEDVKEINEDYAELVRVVQIGNQLFEYGESSLKEQVNSTKELNLQKEISLALSEKNTQTALRSNAFARKVFDNTLKNTIATRGLKKELAGIAAKESFKKVSANLYKMRDAILSSTDASDELKSSFANIESRMPALEARYMKLNKWTKVVGKSTNILRGVFVNLTRAFIGVMVVKSVGQTLEKISSLQASMNSLKLNPNFGEIEDQFNNLGKATNGLMSKMDALGAVNKALYMNVDLTNGKLTKLSQMVTKVAVGMGQDTGQLLNDFVTALAKGSPIILDNVGVLLKFEEAQRLTYDSIEGTKVSYKEWIKTQDMAAKRANFTAQGIKKLEEITKDLAQPVNSVTAGMNYLKDSFLDVLPIIKAFSLESGILKFIFKSIVDISKATIEVFGWLYDSVTKLQRHFGFSDAYSSFLKMSEATEQFNDDVKDLDMSLDNMDSSFNGLNDKVREYLKLVNVAKDYTSDFGLVSKDIKANRIGLTDDQYQKVITNIENSKEAQDAYTVAVATTGKVRAIESREAIRDGKLRLKGRQQSLKLRSLELKREKVFRVLESKLISESDKKLHRSIMFKRKYFGKLFDDQKISLKTYREVIKTLSYQMGKVDLRQMATRKKIKNKLAKLDKQIAEEKERNERKYRKIREKNNKKALADKAVAANLDIEKMHSVATKTKGVWFDTAKEVTDFIIKGIGNFKELSEQGKAATIKLKGAIGDILTKSGVSYSKKVLNGLIDKLIQAEGLNIILGKGLNLLPVIFKRIHKKVKPVVKDLTSIKDKWVEMTKAAERKLMTPFDRKFSETIDTATKSIKDFIDTYRQIRGTSRDVLSLDIDTFDMGKFKNKGTAYVNDFYKSVENGEKALTNFTDKQIKLFDRRHKITYRALLSNIKNVKANLKKVLKEMDDDSKAYTFELGIKLDNTTLRKSILDVRKSIKDIDISRDVKQQMEGFDFDSFRSKLSTLTSITDTFNAKVDARNKLRSRLLLNQKAEEINAIKLAREKDIKDRQAELDNSILKGKAGSKTRIAYNKKHKAIMKDIEEKYQADILEIVTKYKGKEERMAKAEDALKLENTIRIDNAIKEQTQETYRALEIGYNNDLDRAAEYLEGKVTLYQRVGNDIKEMQLDPSQFKGNNIFDATTPLTKLATKLKDFRVPNEFKDKLKFNIDSKKFVTLGNALDLPKSKLAELIALMNKLNGEVTKLGEIATTPAKMFKNIMIDAFKDIGNSFGELIAAMTFNKKDNTNSLLATKRDELNSLQQSLTEGAITQEDYYSKSATIEKNFLKDKANYEKAAEKQALMGLASQFMAKSTGYAIEGVIHLAQHKIIEGQAELGGAAALGVLAQSLGAVGSSIQTSSASSSREAVTSEKKDIYNTVQFNLFEDKRELGVKLGQFTRGY